VNKKIVTLLTDFGLTDSYVAEMKAVILSICPNVTIIDISHVIAEYNIRMGAYLLARSVEYFPLGTIHVAVVDPGVGGPRKPILVETNKGFLVGPDNGLLMLAAEKQGIKHVYKIENKKYMLPKISETFHGRDIFAPTAAYLALGIPPQEFGKEVFDYVKPSFSEPKIQKNKIFGEIIHIDHFGNLVTNIKPELLYEKKVEYGSHLKIALGKRKPVKTVFLRTYSEAPQGKILVMVGSGDFIEISANLANAAKLLNAKIGMKIILIL